MKDPRAYPLEHAIERTILILARRETVFRYFTDSARFAAWWGAGSSIEGRPGGAVKICYPGGELASGQVLEIEPPERIVFSYGYDAPGRMIPPGGSTVRVTFDERHDGTLVTLRHEVDSVATRDAHVAGWRLQLALFSNVVAKEQHAGLPAILDRYFTAWSEKSPEALAESLRATVAEDVAFRDSYGAIFGRDELGQHLALIPVYMPGLTLRRKGEPRQCQGTAVVDWVAEGSDGTVKASGTNVLDLAPDGRLSRIVGLWNV